MDVDSVVARIVDYIGIIVMDVSDGGGRRLGGGRWWCW